MKKKLGFTLIEAAVILLILSIALIPIIKMVANKKDSGTTSITATSAAKDMSIEVSVANTILESVLSNNQNNILTIAYPNYSKSGVPLVFDSSGYLTNSVTKAHYFAETDHSDLEKGTPSTTTVDTQNRIVTFPKFKYGTTNVYYQWELRDVSYAKVYTDKPNNVYSYQNALPYNNNLIRAVLKIYTPEQGDPKTSTMPSYSIATNIFNNFTQDNPNIAGDLFGIVLVSDLSGSMLWAKTDNIDAPINDILKYRPGINDLIFAESRDDPYTPYDERYNPCLPAEDSHSINKYDIPPGDYLLDHISPSTSITSQVDFSTLTVCTNNVNGHGPGIQQYSNTNFNSIFNLTSDFYNPPYQTSGDYTHLVDLQRGTDIYNLFVNLDTPSNLDKAMSRVEMSRTSALAFIETLETDPSTLNKIRLGYVPFSGSVSSYNPGPIPISGPDASASFSDIKQTYMLYNRICSASHSDVNACPTTGTNRLFDLPNSGTNYGDPLRYAQNMFNSYENQSVSHKFFSRTIIFQTDGAPNEGYPTDPTGLRSLAASLAANSNATSTKARIDIYSVGLFVGDPQYLQGLTAGNNPHNTLVIVNNMSQLATVYENIARTIELNMLLAIQGRYGNLDKSANY